MGKGHCICRKRGTHVVYRYIKDSEGTGAMVYGHNMRQRFSFSLGQYTTVFQATVQAVKACTSGSQQSTFAVGSRT